MLPEPETVSRNPAQPLLVAWGCYIDTSLASGFLPGVCACEASTVITRPASHSGDLGPLPTTDDSRAGDPTTATGTRHPAPTQVLPVLRYVCPCGSQRKRRAASLSSHCLNLLAQISTHFGGVQIPQPIPSFFLARLPPCATRSWEGVGGLFPSVNHPAIRLPADSWQRPPPTTSPPEGREICHHRLH